MAAAGSALRIGEAARRAGLNPKTLRYYEELGLLASPPRTRGGYRLYGDGEVRRLRFIASARQAGFRLGEIKEMLALRERGHAPCSFVREAIGRRERELDRQIAELRRLREELAALRKRAERLPANPSADRFCHIIER